MNVFRQIGFSKKEAKELELTFRLFDGFLKLAESFTKKELILLVDAPQKRAYQRMVVKLANKQNTERLRLFALLSNTICIHNRISRGKRKYHY